MSDNHPSLYALQKWMQSTLIFPQQVSKQQAEFLMLPSARLSGLQRLGIYQRSYYLRLLHCMREQFPALCYALGKDLFTDFAQQYLEAYPSESHTLYELGKRFPNYLESSRPDKDMPAQRESWIDFMVDLAHFERELFVLFDAPGCEGSNPVDEHVEDARLSLQPCFVLADYRYQVGWYYHEVRSGNEPAFPIAERSLLALVRKNYLTHTFPLSLPQYYFLQRLQIGETVDVALNFVAETLSKPADEVYQSWASQDGTRGRWIDAGFFIDKESQ